MRREDRLNKRAATCAPRPSLWHVDGSWAVFAGPLDRNAPHAHSTAVYLAGLYGTFQLRIGGGDWLSCRSAVIRAGVPYEFDMRGEPLGVLYLEPVIGGADALIPLAGGGEEIAGAVIGRRDGSPLRRHFERRRVDDDFRSELAEATTFASARARKKLDERIERAVSLLQDADEMVSATMVANDAGLSASRFQHLFTREVGVPFRRYRGWHRLRRAIREAAAGASLTQAAYAAGFADQAHFSRAFYATFGAPPSAGL
jgi:AraC-like DNA-binding protein